MSINFYSQLKKNLQGELRENFDLSKSNWLGIGGKAKFFFKPKDLKDLRENLLAGLISRGVKHTTPTGKSNLNKNREIGSKKPNKKPLFPQ